MKRLSLILVGSLLIAFNVSAGQAISVTSPASAPTIDGDLSDWSGDWITVPIKVALEGDKKNRTGALDVEFQASVVGDRFFVAARWPDKKENRIYKPWVWAKKKYKRGKDREDMFAVRFDMGGDYNSCMISEADYDVDVWLWSAARTDPNNYASDMWHKITLNPIEDAAEYESDSGKVVYIKKGADEGRRGYKNKKVKKRKEFQGDELPSIDISKPPSGSVADVSAKGVWKEGFWHLELSRKLNTGHNDDVVLEGVKTIQGQIAVFNKGFAEHKSVSEPLDFTFN